jgi:cytochrome c peroxidase
MKNLQGGDIMNRRVILSAITSCVISVIVIAFPLCTAANGTDLTDEQLLGKAIFFDKISQPDWMSCSVCHGPAVGWTGPIPGINQKGAVYRGAIPRRFGNRKPPSAAYATLSPILHYDAGDETFVGGNFWDGRATGEDLGNPAADQARGPFLNPVEQHNYDKAAVCEQVAASKYAYLYVSAFDASIDCSAAGVDTTYDNIARSIADYEGSSEVNQFSSKYDAYLAGKAQLTRQEREGLELFEAEDKGNCAACHPSEPGPYSAHPLFTDFTYDNLGVPRNPDNPFYDMDTVYLDDGVTPINPLGKSWVDLGLGGFLATRAEWSGMAADNEGKQKVPTLRNVAKAHGNNTPKSYTHNGYFKSLKAVVHFYNTRDVKPQCPDAFTTEKDARAMDCWPEAEVPQTVNHDELGNLGLTPDEEDAIVAFLRTLSDGYFDPAN